MELLGGIQRVELAIHTPDGDPAWQPGVTRAVAQLRAAFFEHVTVTEGPAGLYAGVLGDAPRLAHQVDGLVGDHLTVWAVLDDLERGLAERPDAVRWHADRLIRELWQHRQRGADVLYEAYDTDLGGET